MIGFALVVYLLYEIHKVLITMNENVSKSDAQKYKEEVELDEE